jgi:hypothetical protein
MPRYRQLWRFALPVLSMLSGSALLIAGHPPGLAWSLIVWGAAVAAAALPGMDFTWQSHDDA